MKDGKKIEKLVRLIQETLKDSPNTEIYSNFKISNSAGRKREIDVLIVSVVNSISIKIAIECKDYKKPVPAKEIEAFNSKCDRIKDISKKVFVSASGYQADAIEAANEFGIDVYQIDEVTKENINGWFPTYIFNYQAKIKVPLTLKIKDSENNLTKIPDIPDLIVHYGENKSISLIGYVWNNVVVEGQNKIRAYLIVNFIQKKENDDISRPIDMPFTLKTPDLYIIAPDSSKIFINEIKGEILTWLEKKPVGVLDAQSFSSMNGLVSANTLTLDVGKNEKVDLVAANNKIEFFHTNSEGKVIRLEAKAKYDPKTEKFEFFKS